MPDYNAAVQAFVAGVSGFLGPPTRSIKYLTWWNAGPDRDFEVAIEQGGRPPNVWISRRWQPKRAVFGPLLEMRVLDGSKSRLQSLRGNTPSLFIPNPVWCMVNINDHVHSAVDAVRGCAEVAGVVPAL